MSTRRRGTRLRSLLPWLAATAVIVGAGSACSAGSEGAPLIDRPVERVLVVSLPGTNWADVRDGRLPRLRRFLDGATVGDLSTRIGRRPPTVADAYLTIGAGTRAVAPVPDGGVAVQEDETYGQHQSGVVHRRRSGEPPAAVNYLAIGTATELNAESKFGATVGLLGDALADHDIGRAVIANGDRDRAAAAALSYDRSAAAALADSAGRIPAGVVSSSLLAEDAAAPFGIRLDADAVTSAFRAAWNESGRRVVLVEASDLSRVAAYRAWPTPAQYRKLRAEALAASDRLLARLLDDVDPRRDAVVVVAPVAPPDAPPLGLVAVKAPASEGGLLRSATTRRDGYVQLADMAPTILTLFGYEAPTDVEGRPFRVGDDARSSGGNINVLAGAVEDAEFRDDLVPVVSLLFVAALVALAAAWALGLRRAAAEPPVAGHWIGDGALAVLGAVSATYVAGMVDQLTGRPLLYLAFVAAFAVAVAVASRRCDRRWPGTAPILALASVVLVVAGDVAVGGRLQLNTVFGYSVSVGGRFAGVGNLAFALLASSALLLAVLLAHRFGRRGTVGGIAVLAAVVLVDGLPFLGGDVGGVLSMVPAFLLVALALLGRRLYWRHGLAASVIAVAVVLTFAFVDLARPAGARTHLARIAEHIVALRWDPIGNSVSRRWQASFGTAALSGWVVVGLITLAVVAYLVVIELNRRREGQRQLPPGPATAVATGLPVLAALGLVANDSSFAVPGVMLIVAVPVALLRLLDTPPRPRAEPQ